MWSASVEQLEGERAVRVRVFRNGLPITYGQTVALWQEDETLRRFMTRTLAELPMTGFCWETPPLHASTAGQAFEFVAADCPDLERQPDPNAFAEQFRLAPCADVVDFLNLGRDALLVVPCPLGQPSAYGHFGAFLRRAPVAQIDALWIRVGALMQSRLDAGTVWLNTAGLAVAWLHIRLDNRPKYYRHAPYIDQFR